MEIRRYTFNPFQTNCYVCSSDGQAVIIDPSAESESEQDALLDYIGGAGLTVTQVLLTHAHIDHIFGLAGICDALDLSYSMHRADVPLIANAPEQARLFGAKLNPPPQPGGFLVPGDTVAVGDAELRVRHTPGHSPGSITFVNNVDRVAICGDVLFAGSIGRTDLWEGSLPVLMRSIFDELVPLGNDARICPGHGPETTIGNELSANPFLTGSMEYR